MRSVGERLGRTAMAIYTYVPEGRGSSTFMLDRACGGLDVTYDVADGWRAAARRWAWNSLSEPSTSPPLGWAPDLVGAVHSSGRAAPSPWSGVLKLFGCTDVNGADVMKSVSTVWGSIHGLASGRWRTA